MNASLGLRLASQLVSKPSFYCPSTRRLLALAPTTTTPLSVLRVCANSPISRTIWTGLQPSIPQSSITKTLPSGGKIPSSLTFLRNATFNRRARPSPRARQAPPLPSAPEPTFANPATITGAEQEPIRYSDYMTRPPGYESDDEPSPSSSSARATSRYISLFGVLFLVVHLLWWAPNFAAYAHASENVDKKEFFVKYIKPWKQWLERWFTFSPAVALERWGYYPNLPRPNSEESKWSWLSKYTQFLLPAFSHAEVWHLAFNYFALQALAPTMVRYYGFRRSVVAYLTIAVLDFTILLAYDRYFNPYTNVPQPVALTRWRETHEMEIRKERKAAPTKAEKEEHYKLGEHCRPGLGASGVLYGFLAISAIVNPQAQFQLMFIPISFSVRTLFMALCTMDLTCIGLRTEVWGTAGHLTGAVGGLIVWAAWLRRVKLPPDVQRQLMVYLRRKKMGLL
ncbi:hypothetical protein TWF694_001396 [Orbilia ellipsospora]|uniref:Peptidase S54 rhomboid domain-containing protein n=1 Tax=Orbilia ellipsospora TaxID=2528407 RepID=A0AAV9XSA4_9PEZI